MNRTRRGKAAALAVAAALALSAAACSGDDGDGDGETTGTDVTTTTAATGGAGSLDPERVRGVVEALADDELEGRDNGSPGSVLAQDLIIEEVDQFAQPLAGDGADAYRHEFDEGTNLLAVIPGGDRADEHVVLGAHYDGLGRDCDSADPADDICNGAADNAAGVAIQLEIGRALAAADEPPSRSVILAFWDAEEDGLLGARAYLDDPPVPLDDTVAYLNWDIQGVNLLPSLAQTTVMVGAETGGPNLVAAAQEATGASDLRTLALSLLFGQGRSDHAPFAEAGVPIVFFTDANNACYHTAQEDTSNVDFAKLDQQTVTAVALAQDLVATDDLPAFDPDVPAASFEDAVSMQAVVTSAEADFGRFPPEGRATIEEFLVDLDAMVEAGEEAFDDDAVSTLLGGSVEVVELLSEGDCESFIE